MFYGKVKNKGINMKSQEGITLVSLAIYITVMIIVVLIMNSIITTFYSNTESIDARVQEVIGFNKFNTYFLKEIKLRDNVVDNISEDNENPYILFTSGNSFSMNNKSIYYNNIKVCDKVADFIIKKGKDGDGIDETIINITIKFDNFSKSINYKLENIY